MYYDGTKLMSLMDADGNKPELYLSVGNRTAGKSVYFKRMLLNNFIKSKSKFVLMFRFNYELSGACEMFFNDIESLFFEGSEMRCEAVAKGLFYKLFYNEAECGFALALANADALKKYSSYFVDVYNIFLDEFQSETNHYAPDEIKKFQSLHVTIARGKGKQYRYVRTMMASNSVTILNPYFVSLGIHKILRSDTHYLRGKGYVLEQTFNETASKALSESGFSKAFSSDSNYMEYASQNVYLNDNQAFIEKITGRFLYKGTIKYDNRYYGIREFPTDGIVHISNKADMTFPLMMSFKVDDHNQNMMMVDKSTMIMVYLKKAFERGQVRFQDLQCKNIIFDILSLK